MESKALGPTISRSSTPRIPRLRYVSRSPVSLERPVGEDDDCRLGDTIEDVNHTPPDTCAARGLLRDATERMLSTLTEREAEVLRLRFGIGVRNDYTLEEVGQVFGLTRERIRQIQTQALRKIRRFQQDGDLRAHFEQSYE